MKKRSRSSRTQFRAAGGAFAGQILLNEFSKQRLASSYIHWIPTDDVSLKSIWVIGFSSALGSATAGVGSERLDVQEKCR